jgi:hypothetical protein
MPGAISIIAIFDCSCREEFKWVSARSDLCNGDAGEREQPTEAAELGLGPAANIFAIDSATTDDVLNRLFEVAVTRQVAAIRPSDVSFRTH